jgi:hypothetical protein
VSPFSRKNRQDVIAIFEETVLIFKTAKFLAVTLRRPGQLETIIQRRPGRRGELKNPITSPMCE